MDGSQVARRSDENASFHQLARVAFAFVTLHIWLGCYHERGWEIGGIYHSHVRSEPSPSQTDINYAANWPGVEWIIVGLAEGGSEVRSYLIENGQVREVPPEVQ